MNNFCESACMTHSLKQIPWQVVEEAGEVVLNLFHGPLELPKVPLDSTFRLKKLISDVSTGEKNVFWLLL